MSKYQSFIVVLKLPLDHTLLYILVCLSPSCGKNCQIRFVIFFKSVH